MGNTTRYTGVAFRSAVVIGMALTVMYSALAIPAIPTAAQDNAPVVYYGYTYQQPDGNRYVIGQGVLPESVPLDVELDGRPVWVVAARQGADASIWAVVLEDSSVQVFRVVGRDVTPIMITPERLPVGMPPLLRVEGDAVSLVVPPDDLDASPLTHPVIVQEADGSSMLAVILTDGTLTLWRESGDVIRLSINALPDARILQDGSGNIALYTEPSTAYEHGVLGDAIESRQVTVIAAMSGDVLSTISAGDGDPGVVFEGIAPIWADLDGDGERDMITTLSDAQIGARIVVNMVSGPAIGRGFRWRHQIAVAPFGPQGELELADVLTPHIGGVVEFFRFDGDAVGRVASLGSFTSHGIGSRNLDMAAASDFDGDGQVELLVPGLDMSELSAIRRVAGDAIEAWSLPIGGRMSTNLGAVTLAGDQIAVGVGRSDNTLRLWLPVTEEAEEQ
jgi:hypothetical protein